MIHNPRVMGTLVIPYCADCGIRLPANYRCTECAWEEVRDDQGTVAEVCVDPCLLHNRMSILRV